MANNNNNNQDNITDNHKQTDFGFSCDSDKGIEKGSEKKSLLGNKTKCSSKVPSSPDTAVDAVVHENLIKRYNLQNITRAIYSQEGKKKKMKYPMNFHRTARCMYVPIADDVEIHKSVEYKRTFYSGLFTCGSVWCCPICAAKIQERRRKEVSQGMDWHYNTRQDVSVLANLNDDQKAKVLKANPHFEFENPDANKGKNVMVTLTFPHKKTDNIKLLLKKQSEAFRYLRSGGAFTEFKKEIGFIGLIRSLEVVHGDNGYHPHTHELWFVKSSADADKMLLTLKKLWLNACAKAKLIDKYDNKKVNDFNNHAVDIKDNASNSDYLNKMDDSKNWGVDREIAKASTKQGSKKGKHPYSFLTEYDNGSEYHRKLWLDYTKAFHGKSQLYFSPRLKAMIGLDELTDEEIAAKTEDNAEVIAHLTNDDFKLIRRHNGRAIVLILAENDGLESVLFYLNSLRKIEARKQINKTNL